MAKPQNAHLVNQAVRHNTSSDKTKDMWDKLFVKAFEGLVYAQIWEDPEADMLALNLNEKSRIVQIASGGCNVLAYLSKSPQKVDAVDLNRHHVALNKLKLSAIKHLPTYEMFFNFFGHADQKENITNFDHYIAAHLDLHTRGYWSSKKFINIRRIKGFQNNYYRFGLLGRLIRLVHLVANIYGKSPRKTFEKILQAKTQAEREALFEYGIGSLYDKRLVGFLGKIPAMLYGLGIPPAQYEALIRSGKGDLMKTLYERTRNLAIGFDPHENYFAWQAFMRRYDTENRQAIPTYLKKDLYETIKSNVDNVDIHHANIIDFLKTLPDQDRTAYLLLDAQDWMSAEVMTDLWREITRTAKEDARVVFRTADYISPLEEALPQEILDQWIYDKNLSETVTKADRSAIYGASHVYVKK